MATSKDFKVKNGIQVAGQVTSTVATGTAPMVVSSTTVVANLNADLHDGMQATSANTASTVVSRDASGNFAAGAITVATPALSDSSTTVATTAFVDQFRDVPANAQAATYTLVLSDRGKCIDANGNITIPANSAVAFPVGATIGFINVSAAAITIAITTDTLHLAGTATVGTRTLASWGMASARKVSATVWVITGAGLT